MTLFAQIMYRVVQKKGTVLLSTSLAWPAVAGCSRAETFSLLSAISFAQPCTVIEERLQGRGGNKIVFCIMCLLANEILVRKTCTLTKMHEEETVIGGIGAGDNTKFVLRLETRYLSRLSFAASRSLTFQSKCDEHQSIYSVWQICS